MKANLVRLFLLLILIYYVKTVQAVTRNERNSDVLIEKFEFYPNHIATTVGSFQWIFVKAFISKESNRYYGAFTMELFSQQGLTSANSPIHLTTDELYFEHNLELGKTPIAGFGVICSYPVNRAIVAINESSSPGVQVLKQEGPPSRLSFLSIDVEQSRAVEVVATIFGWMYFVAWTISFYPQVYTIISRRSVVGLDFNYILLTFIGFVCYSIYNCTLIWNKTVQEQYFEVNPFGAIPVQPNDVFFSLHAAAIVLLYMAATFLFEKGNQRYSCIGLSLAAICTVFATVILVLASQDLITWLTFIEYLSYVKLVLTFLKYVPQVWLNFRRKSTDGFNMKGVILDFIGGILSLIQMMLIAYNFDDWPEVLGNFTKFGLGILTLIFDTIYFLQYCIYSRRRYDESNERDIKSLVYQRLSEDSYGSFKSTK